MWSIRNRVGLSIFFVLALALPASAQERRPLTPADYGRWESLGPGTLSPDGKWLAYLVGRVEGDGELRIRELATDSTRVVPVGNRPVFSKDSRWLAYTIEPPRRERERLERAKQPVRTTLGILDLRTGEEVMIDGVAAFAFSDAGPYLALRGYPAPGRRGKGADLTVRDLTTGVSTTFGNVSEFAWQGKGTLLAMTVDTESRLGNGVQVYDPATGLLRTLASDTITFSRLTWRKDAADLAAMIELRDSAYEGSTYRILAWQGVAGKQPRFLTFDHTTDPEFPADTRIVDLRPLTWSDDGRMIFFGVKEWERKPGAARDLKPAPDSAARPAADSKATPVADSAARTAADSTARPSADSVATPVTPDSTNKTPQATARATSTPRTAPRRAPAPAPARVEPANVEVWHASDVDIIPRQRLSANRDRNANYFGVWHLSSGRFVQLSDSLIERIALTEGQRLALGITGRNYEREKMFGPVYRDHYQIDLDTGERKQIAERIQFAYGASPGSRYFLYLQDDDYWSYDLRTGVRINLTADIETSFVDLDNDHTIEQKPPYGVAGWTKGDRSVIVYDKYDLWEIRLDGGGATRLTDGAAEQIQYRYVRLDDDETAIDLSRPIYLSAYGEWTKEYGYARLRRGRAVERLVWLDRSVSRLAKAKDAEVYTYIVQGFDQSPNYFVGGPSLGDARQVSDTNPFQEEFAWGHAELVDFTNARGERLQGALYYPADYEPGKQYPMIVYIYEIRSNTIHTYTAPSERSPYNPTVFTSKGYFFFQPDITYRGRNPGLSAVESIVPAVEKVLEMGQVDRKRIGLVGHSWGAYQTAFTITQTDLFAAAVAGAPLTNLISMSLQVYWNTGDTNARIFEISQGRMEVPFWQDLDAYLANSPVFHIEQLNTPLLVAFGDKDGAVDWSQGVELYNAARRAGKDLVMLVYPGENHSLRQKPNQVDYHRRIQAWFDHYLKGATAPRWITHGTSVLERQREVEQARRVTAPVRGAPAGN